MPQLTANNITIEYDTFGDSDDKPLLLVMGLGAQMIAWDEKFCEQLASSGHYVIRYDNRDVGLSTRFHDHGEPDLETLVMQLLTDSPVDVPYTLEDMAMDGMSLLSELEIERAHICGASLGGNSGAGRGEQGLELGERSAGKVDGMVEPPEVVDVEEDDVGRIVGRRGQGRAGEASDEESEGAQHGHGSLPATGAVHRETQ